MKAFDEEMMSKLRSHLDSFYRSVELSLVITQGKQGWLPVYFLAEYSHLPSDEMFRILFDAPESLIISGHIDKSAWDDYVGKIQDGGQVTPSLTNGNSVAVTFEQWSKSDTRFATGLEARLGWKRMWPHFRTNFRGPSGSIEPGLWSVMENAARTYVVPYSSFSEAVSDILHVREESLEFRTHSTVHGAVLLPIFAAFDSVKYDQSGQKVGLAATVILHSKENHEKVCVSARLETFDKAVMRIKKTHVPQPKVRGPEEGCCRSVWLAPLDLDAASIRDTRLSLAYDVVDSSPFLIDEENLRSVPALTAKSEIKRLMESRSDRRRLDYWLKIEKWLLDEKGEKFEEAVFRLLARIGFDVAWESKNNPIDILAISPNGCLVVDCTSDPPSAAMAQELKELARSYTNESNPYVMPVLATNQIVTSDLDQDLQRMQQNNEVYFLTRDRLRSLLGDVESESLARTARYLQKHFMW